MIEKRWKSTDRSYKHSHKKSAKSFAKGLDKAETRLIIFSNKQQATSNKRTERYKRAICSMHPEHTQISSTNNTHRTEALSSCVFYITPFKETATPAENAKDYKRMSYKASLKTSCVLGVLRG